MCFVRSYLKKEEEHVKDLCDKIIAMKPDLVVSEKGISDLAIHFLQKANISAIRRYSTISPLTNSSEGTF